MKDIVRFRLADLRSRLLNLSTSNKLLSTKFSDWTRSHVRVVDELPDILFASLQRKSMTFKALPPMEDQRADEHSLVFMNALDDARLTDETYKGDLVALEKRGLGEDSKEYLAVERRLKDRVRAKMNLSRQASSPRSALSAHAREHGINPEYDLPRPEKGPRNSLHHDGEIQLLLLPDQMERTLSRIDDQARGIRQETGIDTLYMAFGFLEWRDAPASQNSHYAPLLLLPVEMKRERRSGQYVFTVAGTGDDPQPNITLAEKLKQDFALALPTLEQDDGPETYWRRIERDILKHQRDWCLRRWVAIGVFPFARMAMYHDLDPDKWDICERPLVGEILGGTQTQSEGPAVSYDVDDPTIEQLAPVLIADADASQHSAVIDAVKGRNFVIKGPPGTGKSQTITNIIGAALHANKTVLFVAEKMAALEVVFSRLSEADLGDFCLELHSHKASRKEVLESLRKRLALRRSRPPDDVESERRQLRREKETLNRYVDTLKRPYGCTGLTVHDVLWEALKAAATPLPQPIKQLRVRNASELDNRTLVRAYELLRAFAEARDACFADGSSIETHPWRGVSCSTATPFDLEDLCDQARHWASSTAAALEELGCFRVHFAAPDRLTPAEWQGIAGSLQEAADVVTSSTQADFLALLRDSPTRSAAANELSLLERLNALEETMAGKLDPEATDLERLGRAAISATQLGLSDATVGEVSAVREQEAEVLQQMERAVEALLQIAARVGWRGALTVADVRLLKEALARVAATPERALRLRTRGMRESGAGELLAEASERAQRLRARHEELSSNFALERAPAPHELRRHADRLEQGGWLPLLSGSWRRARKAYRQLARRQRRADGRTMAKALAGVAEHLHECRAFEEDQQLQNLLQEHFKGVSTDFEPTLEAAAFVRDIKRRLLAADGFEGQLRAALLRADSDLLVTLAGSSWCSHVDAVHQAAERCRPDAPHTTVRDNLAARVAEIESLEQGVAAAPGLSRAVKLGELRQLAWAAGEHRQLRERLAASPFAAALPPEATESLDARRAFLAQCVRAAQIITQLPPGLATAIGDAPQRLGGSGSRAECRRRRRTIRDRVSASRGTGTDPRESVLRWASL